MVNKWGTKFPPEYESEIDNYSHRSSLGGMETTSRNLGDGHWCPVCWDENKKFSWVEQSKIKGLKTKCNKCDTLVKDMDYNKIKKLMKEK